MSAIGSQIQAKALSNSPTEVQKYLKLILGDHLDVCLPGPAGNSIDTLQVQSLFNLKKQALELFDQCDQNPNSTIRLTLGTLRETIADLSAVSFANAFNSTISYTCLHPEFFSKNPTESSLRIVRFLIGAPEIEAFTIVIPASTFESGSLWLPHLNATLDGDKGSVAVQVEKNVIRFTWVDGYSLTCPNLPLGTEDEESLRLQSGSWVGGWPVLNGLPEALEHFQNDQDQITYFPSASELSLMEEGIETLHEIWPEAYTGVRRIYNSILIQPPRFDHTTSITLDSLQGCFIASLRDPIQIADALCHESSHARLNLLFQHDPLINDDGEEKHPSPWRQDRRSLKGVLNGVHAFLNVCLFYQKVCSQYSQNKIEEYERIFTEQRKKVLEAWDYFSSQANPTAIGEDFLCQLDRLVKQL